jgi:hypothetical protein
MYAKTDLLLTAKTLEQWQRLGAILGWFFNCILYSAERPDGYDAGSCRGIFQEIISAFSWRDRGKGRTLSVGVVTEIETTSSHEHEFWLKSNNNNNNNNFMCWPSPVSARGNYCPGSTCQPRDHTGSPHYDVIIKQDRRQVTHAYIGN